MPELGRAALVAAFGLIVYAVAVGGYASYRGRRRLLDSATNALFAAFAAVGIAALVLIAALAGRDFSLDYVARLTSRELPLGYTLAAFWSGQEGSLLLWLLVLTGAASAAIALNRRLVREVLPWTVPIIGGVALFFAFLLVFVASPFATQAAPADGAGMNPSLQNPYMIAHPPLLYLGYVGLTIPFAFAMAALASRRVDERWIVVTRRWTLAAWTFLGFGILLGAKWAYEEVGWGGWYAWDPVENAALMPWLVATAFLHSVMVQEKKNMLRVWNVVLVAGAFLLSLFGTFLTRSGVISSIHSFTQSSIGPFFLGFIAVAAAFSIALILSRLTLLRSKTRLESLVSREAAFLYNNLFLVALALTILWGVIYPLVSEAVRGVAVSVGAPYYDFFAIVFGLPLVLLMGIGPVVAWRRASLRSLASLLVVPAGVALGVGLVLLLAGAGSSPAGLVGYTFAAFVMTTIVLEFVRGTRARKSLGERRLVVGLLGPDRAQPPTLRRLHRARRDHPPPHRRRRHRRLLDARAGPARPGRVADGRRLPRRLHRQRAATGRERAGGARQPRRLAERGAGRDDAGGQEPLLRRAADVERGRDPHRLAARRGPLRHRGHVQPGRVGVPEGDRQPARQPHLALRARLRPRLGRRHVAGCARAAPARGAVRGRGRRGRAGLVEAVALALGALLAAACVVFVARPLLRQGREEATGAPNPEEEARLRLLEERDRSLAALKELEFDHRTGKISDEDYRALVGPLRRAAGEALKALEHEDRQDREREEVDAAR